MYSVHVKYSMKQKREVFLEVLNDWGYFGERILSLVGISVLGFDIDLKNILAKIVLSSGWMFSIRAQSNYLNI